MAVKLAAKTELSRADTMVYLKVARMVMMMVNWMVESLDKRGVEKKVD